MLRTFKIACLLFSAVLIGGTAGAVTSGDLVVFSDSLANLPSALAERPDLTHYYDTLHFKIHYETEGEYAVYHADEDIAPPDGVPDYINRMGEFLEQSWSVYIDQSDFDIPPPDDGLGGDNRYDIYVMDIAGLTVPDYPSDYYPERIAYTAFSYIGNDLRNAHHPDDPYPFLKATCAHEFFHAIQMAYRVGLDDPSLWWIELTANWGEERVFDDLNEVYYYLPDYYLKINRSIYRTGGSHMYGAWVWAEYLSQNYDVDFVKKVFEKLIHLDNSLDAIKAAFDFSQPEFDLEFTRYGIWNFFTFYNAQPGFFEEAYDFPATVPLARVHYYYPTNWVDSPQRVENLGLAYIYFANPGYNKSDLRIDFRADEVYPIGVGLAAIYSGGQVEVSQYNLEPGEQTQLWVRQFNHCRGALMCVDWRYQHSDSDDSAGYSYNAELDTLMTGIASDDTNQPRQFELKGNFPNPFNLSSNIIFYWNSRPVDYKISIYDIKGALVRQLTGLAAAGENTVTWKADPETASGLYLYKLTVGDESAGGRMMLLK